MSENWKLGIGVYDSFDREWALCTDYSKKPYHAISPEDMDEAIKICIEKNVDNGFNPNGAFTDHYGVIRYELGEYGLIARCKEVWCPYNHKDRFVVDLSEVIKALQVTANTVRGNGMLMCADTIEWAIEQITKEEK